MSTYRAALIGCGGRGRANAEFIRDNPQLELVAVVDPNRKAAEAVREEPGLEDVAVFTNHEEMLRKVHPEFCTICVWTGLHLPLFRDCAGSGVRAVFLEKPMAETWGDSREIARIADETGCRLSFCHQRRFCRGNEIARELIADGLLGDLIRMDLYSPNGLLDCGTHTIDQAFSYLADEPGVKWVHGAIDISDTFEAFGIPDGIMFTGTMMYDSGVLANVYCSMPDADHWTGVKVFGTKGFMEFDWVGKVNKYAICDRPGFVPPEIVEEKSDPMRKSYEDVVQSLESDTENMLHYKKALRTTEVIFAFYESIRARRRVELPLKGVDGHPLVELLEKTRSEKPC